MHPKHVSYQVGRYSDDLVVGIAGVAPAFTVSKAAVLLLDDIPSRLGDALVSATGFEPALHRFKSVASYQLGYADSLVPTEGLEPTLSSF